MSNDQLISSYYIAHRDELLAFVSCRLGGSDEAEDIVQNVFLRLLTSNKMITEITLPALIYTIARHLISDYYRRHTVYEAYERQVRLTVESLQFTVYSLQSTDVESVFSAKEITEQLERGLARVPENCREVYRMHIYGGMKVSEISQTLGDGYKSGENRLGIARKAMRHYLRFYA